MSYILDALRKSDRERRQGELPPLESSVTSGDPGGGRTHWALWLILLLVGINVATVSFLLWMRDDPSAPTEGVRSSENLLVRQSPAPTRAPEPAGPAPETTLQDQKPPIERPVPTTRPPDVPIGVVKREPLEVPPQDLSISDMLAQQNQLRKKSASTTPVRADPVAPKIAAPADPPPTEGAPRAKKKARLRKEAASDAPTTANASRGEAPPEPETRDSTPYFDELPRDFRRRVPSVTINVYVSSSNPEERFVIANMSKFRPGQEIAEGLTLEDIEQGHMVLRFEGKRFRMKRP